MRNFESIAGVMFIMVVVTMVSCNCNKQDSKENAIALNYEDQDNWVSMPSKIDNAVDVFYVYPTIYNGTERRNMDVNNEQLRKKAQAVTKKQASVFGSYCNLFAPYYPQMSMVVITMPQDTLDKYFAIGYKNVHAAFKYYLDSLNNGRPFILAGHSQGTMMLLNLMKEEFADTNIMNQLIAAYLIGYSVTDEDLKNFPWLKIAEDSTDIGVIISYNTQSADATGSPVLLEGARSINPLSWNTSFQNVQKEKNLGAVFFKDDGEVDTIISQFTNARISENGALISDDADEDKYSFMPTFPKGVYHVYDYSFYYYNLRKNVKDRIMAYKKKNI